MCVSVVNIPRLFNIRYFFTSEMVLIVLTVVIFAAFDWLVQPNIGEKLIMLNFENWPKAK